MTVTSATAVTFLRKANPERALIIGGGLAGLFTALKLAPLPVTVLSPRPLGQGAASAWAQGGIAAAMGEGDLPEAHAADTIAAGAGLVDEQIASVLAGEASSRIHDLLSYGVPFDRDLEGKLRLSQEAAHSARRIVRVNGDQAGKAVMAALISAVVATPSITVFDNVEAIDLVEVDGRVTGVYAVRNGAYDRAFYLPAKAVILATGGSGQLYRVTTNPQEAYGGGLAMAARAGAIIADPEFVQFHPTAFDLGRDPAPLASEALRGDGALLVNAEGERFMLAVNDKAELAPRDIVARAVHREIVAGRGAFLDCRALDLQKAFPTAYEVCESAGLDPAFSPIPIAPAAHYHMGGVSTDARGRTTLSGLWACGETASTGAHGANRLASNSLLEAVVFAARVAADVEEEARHWYAMGGGAPKIAESIELPAFDARTMQCHKDALRDSMSRNVGVERSADTLKAALEYIVSLEGETLSPQLKAMQTVAVMITAAAYERKESRGGHCRLDYPHMLAVKGKRTFMKLSEAKAIAARIVTPDGLHGVPQEQRQRKAS